MRQLQSKANALLAAIEADNCATLYKARWNAATAMKVVPQLAALLDSNYRDTLLRALNALVVIRPEAFEAAPKIVKLLRSPEDLVVQAAAIALARVSLKNPHFAVKPLMDAAEVLGGEKHVILALIELRTAAKSASPVFLRALESRSAGMRRLALRGLVEIGADTQVLATALKQAAKDRSKEVREYTAKVSKGERA